MGKDVSILDNFGSGNSLLPYGPKSLPEAILTCHQYVELLMLPNDMKIHIDYPNSSYS